MVDKAQELLKYFFSKALVERKIRILRYITCIIILFVAFCKYYWNILVYINLPCPPIKSEFVVFFELTRIKVFVAWILFFIIIQFIQKNKKNRFKMQLFYLYKVLDFLFAVYFIIYAVSLWIQFENGVLIQIKTESIVSIIYLVCCGFEKTYSIHKRTFEKKEQQDKLIYTHFCDNDGYAITDKDLVFYKGKEHKVVEYNNIYRLLPFGERIISEALVTLEDAASNIDGNLRLVRAMPNEE